MALANPQLQIFFQLFLATFLGALIGVEREIKKREAGLQTFSLVCLGSCVFTIVAFHFHRLFGGLEIDLVRILQAVAIGIGFIGAGTIFKSSKGVEGLTTAAGLWVTAAIGTAIGSGFYLLAFLSTLFSLLVLAGFGILEEKFFPRNET